MEQRESRTIQSIQILRGLAALSVVLCHYRYYLVPNGGDMGVADKLFSWGGIGVDLFFVLSGFIMVLVTRGKENSIQASKYFLLNRLTRVLPIYYVILVLAFLTNGAMSTFHYSEKIENLISALTFQPYMLKAAPMYVLENGLYNIRWTLNYELYFYIAFAICLLFKRSFIPLTAWFAAPLIICYAVTGGVNLSTHGHGFSNVWLDFMTNPILLEFGMGAVTGYAYTSLKFRFTSKSTVIPFGVFLAIAYGVYAREIVAYNLFSGACFAVLIFSFAMWDSAIKKHTPACLITLGDMSFSLYLIHNPLASAIAGKVDKIYLNGVNNPIGFFILIFIALVAARLSHKYLEIKLTNIIKRKLMKPHFLEAKAP